MNSDNSKVPVHINCRSATVATLDEQFYFIDKTAKLSTCDCTCGHEVQKPCGHKWDGLSIEFDILSGGSGSSVICSVCGISAISHDEWL